jgi:hypothetical protein
MTYRKADKPHNERNKLRQFKDLDDAFSKALQALDDPDNSMDIPTGPPVRSLAALEQDDSDAQTEARHQEFTRRVEALLNEYGIPHAELTELIETLLEHGLWQEHAPAPRG